MSYSIEALRSLPDDELIRLHDSAAEHTVVGISYYMDELERRSRERSTEASIALARRGFWFGAISTFFSFGALVVAVVTLVLQN